MQHRSVVRVEDIPTTMEQVVDDLLYGCPAGARPGLSNAQELLRL
jgi:hypothetical protein